MDIVEKLPRAPGQREYLIVVVDYFSKWTRLEEAKGNWVEQLPRVLWAYRTTLRRNTGESPFNLVYGTELIVPVEIGEETLRVQQYEPTNNNQERQVDLDVVQKHKDNANARVKAYKEMMTKALTQKGLTSRIPGWRFGVKKTILDNEPEETRREMGGTIPSVEVIGSRTYQLQRMDDKEVPCT
ncbi:UNVERIFIED_CONTAM: hypothetical protein Sangu_3049300 [Sesamum angustifolium]|uniref:Reverse transcriptase domain-containing protein n=1 Tax=Sesamum angustifolium TaxID=2727405 RepID=A0AAW2KDT1_9LAMI